MAVAKNLVIGQHPSLQFAFGFGAVVTERIEFGILVQKSFLRRDRDDHSAVAQKNWLAKLKIPVPQGQSLTLECGKGEIGTPEKIEQGPGIE